MIINTTFERMQEIENEREQTLSNPNFQEWMKQLNVSQSYISPEGRLNAHNMMMQYDYNQYKFNVKV